MIFRCFCATVMLALLLLPPCVAFSAQNSGSVCPDGMVSIESHFCMDTYEYPNEKGTLPVTELTWYEASKLCSKQGKRLCSYREWKTACAGPQGLTYPYGNEYRKGVCNDGAVSDGGRILPSGESESCVSGYGVYDISGNIWEWVSDRYEPGTVEGVDHETRGVQGGSANSADTEELACNTPVIEQPDTVYEYAGFRCCVDMPGAESQAETHSNIALDVGSQLLTSDTQITPGYTIGVDYHMIGQIALVSVYDYRVSADGMNYTIGAGIGDFQFQYVRQDYSIRATYSSITTHDDGDADIYKVKYAPHAVKLPWDGQVAIGSAFYVDGHDSFAQPYVVVSTGGIHGRVNIGANWITGDVPDDSGMFASVRLALSPEALFFADYSSRDFHKTIINDVLLPSAGVDCTGCTRDAFSSGIAFRIDGNFLATLGLFDMNDLMSPFGSVTYINYR